MTLRPVLLRRAIAGPATLLLACGSTSSPATPDAGSSHETGAATTADGGYPYPSANIGFNARKGAIPGNQIMNYTFQGYPNGDVSKGLQAIALADYYDPRGRMGTSCSISASLPSGAGPAT